jgi:streptogramin lyase
MRQSKLIPWIAVTLLALGCSEKDTSRDSGGGSSGGIGDGAGDDGDGGGGGDDGDGGTGGGGGDDDGGDDGGGGGIPKFDLGEMPDVGEGDGCGDGGGGDYEFSYIWIANSMEGTVSKINTRTGVEEARYVSGPAGAQDPSRTSVNLLGDAVVVNRNGGITKIATLLENCPDSNGNGVKDTSNGPGNVLPWGSDECVLWNQPLPASGTQGPRPVAWEGGKDPQDPCGVDTNPRVWVGWFDGANTGHFRRLEGSTGATLDEVSVPNWSGMSWGPYGGAADADGDFWVTGWGTNAPAVQIDAETLAVDYHANPTGNSWFYGMALDANGQVWVGGCDGNVYNFDGAWNNLGSAGGCLRGVQVDREGRAWIAGNSMCRLVEVDTVTKTIVNANIALPGCSTPVGISIDVDGFVWVVDQGSNSAYKVNPDTYQIELNVPGLVGPYTYSDMTGAGLDLVTNPPG